MADLKVYRQEVINYLTEQEDSYFACRGTTKTAVLADTERIDRIAAEHRKCVEQFGCDRAWSLADACGSDPGITPHANDRMSDADAVASVATEMLKTATDDYASRIWAIIKNDVITDVLECTDDVPGFSNGDVALALGRAIASRLGIEV